MRILASLLALLAFATVADAFAFCPQNFDLATPPALPGGWTSVADGSGSGWSTSTTAPDTPPNSTFAADPGSAGNSYLVTPSFIAEAARFEFRHAYQTETGFDGGVLEVAIDGGPFKDILAAGGAMPEGGYNGAISAAFGSPIAGRAAWTGNSGGYVSTRVLLPASARGKLVALRWRRLRTPRWPA